MVNRVTLIGNLGQDPELRSTASGMSVATLRLATTDKVKDKDGNWTDRTEWHTVVCWGRTAETVNQYCKKGKQVYVEGRLQTRSWDKDGVKQYKTEVVAETVRFLGGGGQREEGGGYGGGGNRGGGGYGSGGGGGYGGGTQQAEQPAYNQNDDDGIPF